MTWREPAPQWLVALLVGLFFCAAILAPAEARPEFEVSITSKSTATLSGVDHLEGTRAMLAVRLPPTSTDPLGFGFAAKLTDATIFKYEWQVGVIVVPSYGSIETLTAPPQGTIVAQGNFTLESGASFSEAATVLVADRLAGSAANGLFVVSSVAKDPRTVSQSDPSATYGARSGPNETTGWSQLGNYVVGQPPAMAGEGSGRLRLYWFQSGMTLEAAGERTTLDARVWDERPASAAGPFVRHYVWYEAVANDSAFEFVSPAPKPSVIAVLFAEKLELASVEALSFDSAEKVEGSLPPTSGTVGPSLWVNGQMEVGLGPGAIAPDGVPYDYRVDAKGSLVAYAYGGKAPLRPDSLAVAAATGLLVLLVSAWWFLRDVVADGVGRAWFALYSKLSEQQVLAHEVRDVVFRAIQASPGVNFLALRSLTRSARKPGSPVALGTLRHHLKQLERIGLVASRRVGRYRRYYPTPKGGGGSGMRLAVLHLPSARIVAETILSHPRVSLRELQRRISTRLALGVSGVAYQVARLEQAGLIVSYRDGMRKRFEATDLLRTAASDA